MTMLKKPESLRLKLALEQANELVNAPGVVVGVTVGGHATTLVATGVSDADSNRELHTADQLRIGSITKTFTATGVLQLVDKGVLQLGETISKWVPTVPQADTITVEQLLRHTSGLYNYTDSQDFFAKAQSKDGPRIWEPQELVEWATCENQVFPPGAGWAYSNTNYILLGMIIQEVTRKSLADFFFQAIFTPLNMTDTFLDGEVSRRSDIVPGYASHPEDPTQFIEMGSIMHVSAAWAAGGIVSTAKDLLVFSQALLSERLLKPAFLGQMMDFIEAADPVYPMVNGYGLGLLSMEIADKTYSGHVGNIPGYSSLFAYQGDAEICLVILMNQNYIQLDSGRINVEVIAEALLETILS
jgi:D-alanyl-D-alanine carboxypeptidase